MSISIDGRPLRPLPEELKHFQERDIRWLWRKLDMDAGGLLGSDAGLHLRERIDRIARHINAHQSQASYLAYLVAEHQERVLPKEQLQWIEKDNDRLLIWLSFQLLQFPEAMLQPANSPSHLQLGYTGFPFDAEPGTPVYKSFQVEGRPITSPQAIRPTRLVSTEERHDDFLLAIDVWQESRDNKLKFLAQLKERSIRERTLPRQTKWFRPDEFKQPDQASWAWEYLTRARKACHIAAPSNRREMTAAVLASLDLFWRASESDRTVFIDLMKRTWSQRKYRASDKAKKPYYLRLTKQSREKLAWLAAHHERKDTEILEDLIDGRYRDEFSRKSAK